MVIGWIVATGLFGLSLIAFEGCNVANQMVASPVFFNKTFDTLRGAFTMNDEDYNKTRSVLYRCVHGDGDMASEFELQANLGVFDGVFKQVKDANDLANQAVTGFPASFLYSDANNNFG